MYLKMPEFMMYYKKIGEGETLILLHGNNESTKIFNGIKNILKEYFTVYLIDTRGHGMSLYNGPLHYNDFADDFDKFINLLDIKKPNIVGFSDGAIYALIYALSHEVNHLVLSGINFVPKDIKNYVRLLMKIQFFFSRSRYLKIMLTEPDDNTFVKKDFNTKMMFTFGEHDLIKNKSIEKIKTRFNTAKFVTYLDDNHYTYLNKKQYADDIIKFIKEE